MNTTTDPFQERSEAAVKDKKLRANFLSAMNGINIFNQNGPSFMVQIWCSIFLNGPIQKKKFIELNTLI